MAKTIEYKQLDQLNVSNELFNNIICPNLRIGVRSGLLNPDADGWVTKSELDFFLEFIGLKKKAKIKQLLIVVSDLFVKEKRDEKVNITRFKDTTLDHHSGSAIINNDAGFSQKRMDLLLSFSNEQGRFYTDNFIDAIKHFHHCPYSKSKKSMLGTNIAAFEYSSLLRLYGRFENGEYYLTKEDVVDIWKYNKFPQNWDEESRRNKYSTFNAFSSYLFVMVRRLFHGRGKFGFDSVYNFFAYIIKCLLKILSVAFNFLITIGWRVFSLAWRLLVLTFKVVGWSIKVICFCASKINKLFKYIFKKIGKLVG